MIVSKPSINVPSQSKKTASGRLSTFKQLAAVNGRLVVVFGCGGDRDRGKRPLMGTVAARADALIVTSDNPRSEPPEAIIADILAGIERSDLLVEPDRAKAIAQAIETAGADDVILLAGKGHEPYQEIAGVRHPFSDQQEAEAALARWRERNLFPELP